MFFKKLINKSINKGYEAEECEICQTQFNLFKLDRIHKCKRCCKFICQACGDSKEFVIDEEGNRTPDKHRVCRRCKLDIAEINLNIFKYDMKWEQDSNLAKEWRLHIQQDQPRDYEYHHFLNYFHKTGDKFSDEVEIIEKDVIRGRTDFNVFNYSMKEFFYIIQANVENQHTTRLNIANVLYAIAARFDKVGYCQGMSGIGAFLLCFASEQTSYIIFCDLIQNIFPPMFLERNPYGVPLIGLLAEIHFLKEYYWMFVYQKKPLLMKEIDNWFTPQEEQHTKMIIELAGTKTLLSVFIGVLNFTNLMFVWEELKNHRSFEVIQKAFLAIIYLNRYTIIAQRSFKKLEEYFQKLDSETFKQAYHDIQIDPEARKKLTQAFHEENRSKWSTSKTGNAYTLSKVTNLTESQIKQFQKLLCSGFTNADFVTRIVITEMNFLKIIQIYNNILQRNSSKGEQIMELTSILIRKLYRSYAAKAEGLTFRQFIRCFSICTKSDLKDRIVSIVTSCLACEPRITYNNLLKIIETIMCRVPKRLQTLKVDFMERMSSFFANQTEISISDLGFLLNDMFISEMNSYIKSQCENIIPEVIQEYREYIKQEERIEELLQADKQTGK